MKNETINYLTIAQATDLVDRIANRAEKFNHTMTDNEKESMAELLSDIGVNTSDIIDVSNLADNYAINAEIIDEDEASEYNIDADETLFSWYDNGIKYYCMTW